MRNSLVLLLGLSLALPLSAQAQAPVASKLVNSVHFRLDASELERPGEIILDMVAAEYVRQPAGHVHVVGFAGPKEGGFSAGAAHAKALSERRASNVRYYLFKHGIPLEKIDTRAAGLDLPADGSEDAARRCVEVYFE
jgi:outer membrane protein OmpA-like peptidoglycan-associated protein